MQVNEVIGPNFEKIYKLYKQLGHRIIQTFQAKTKRNLKFSGKQSVPYDPGRLFSSRSESSRFTFFLIL